MKDLFYKYIVNLQNNITKSLEEIDGIAKFKEDLWERPEGGGGKTRIIENGNIFEKGGVNISAVHGELPETMQQHFGVKNAQFYVHLQKWNKLFFDLRSAGTYFTLCPEGSPKTIWCESPVFLVSCLDIFVQFSVPFGT